MTTTKADLYADPMMSAGRFFARDSTFYILEIMADWMERERDLRDRKREDSLLTFDIKMKCLSLSLSAASGLGRLFSYFHLFLSLLFFSARAK